MVDIKRDEDKRALVGTVTVYALVLFFILLMSLLGCGDEKEEAVPGGGIAVSYGDPDQGGPDDSAAEQQEEEESTPPEEEEYIPDNQLTSDVEEAPVVKKTKPTVKPPVKPTKPVDKPTEKVKPKEPVEKPRVPNQKSLFGGQDAAGAGKGGDTDNGGIKGKPDGTGENPEGDGIGDRGKGTGSGPTSGPVVGKIGGYDAKIVPPESGIQENGVVRLKVCVNAAGVVTQAKHDPIRGAAGTTMNSDLINRAIRSIRKSSFKNVSGATQGCGYFTYTFKVR